MADYFGSGAKGAAGGAATGATIGAYTGNPYGIAAGAIIGGVVGGGLGLWSAHKQDEAEDEMKANRKKMDDIRRAQWQARMQSLDTMSQMYDPYFAQVQTLTGSRPQMPTYSKLNSPTDIASGKAPPNNPFSNTVKW